MSVNKTEHPNTCNICSIENDDETTYGYIGMIPFSLCVFCCGGLDELFRADDSEPDTTH